MGIGGVGCNLQLGTGKSQLTNRLTGTCWSDINRAYRYSKNE